MRPQFANDVYTCGWIGKSAHIENAETVQERQRIDFVFGGDNNVPNT